MTKYLLTCWDDEYVVEADLVQASAPIMVDGDSTPYQTADCRHSSDELRTLIAAWLYRDTADADEAAEVADLEEITADWIADQDPRPSWIEDVGMYIACVYGDNGDAPGECEVVIEQAKSHGELAFRSVDRDDSGDHETGEWSLHYDAVLAEAKKYIAEHDETPDPDEQIAEILQSGWFDADVDASDIREIVDYCHSHNHLGQGHVIIDRAGRREWVTTGYVEHDAIYIYIPYSRQPWAAYAHDVLEACNSKED